MPEVKENPQPCQQPFVQPDHPRGSLVDDKNPWQHSEVRFLLVWCR
jgi:hypothetical protein